MSQPFNIITDPDVEARRAARAEEYGTWECGPAPIEVGGARAFNEGDPVPKSTVERLGLDALGAVVATGTHAEKSAEIEAERQRLQDESVAAQIKAAQDAQAESAPAPRRRAKTTDTANEGAPEGGN